MNIKTVKHEEMITEIIPRNPNLVPTVAERNKKEKGELSMKMSDIKQSKYLSKADLGDAGKILVTIHSVTMANVAPKDQPAENKPIIKFVEGIKPMVCNATNFGSIIDFSGHDDSDNWGGVKMVIYFDPNIFYAGKKTGGLRVRAPKLSATKQVQAQPKVEPVVEEIEDFDM